MPKIYNPLPSNLTEQRSYELVNKLYKTYYPLRLLIDKKIQHQQWDPNLNEVELTNLDSTKIDSNGQFIKVAYNGEPEKMRHCVRNGKIGFNSKTQIYSQKWFLALFKSIKADGYFDQRRDVLIRIVRNCRSEPSMKVQFPRDWKADENLLATIDRISRVFPRSKKISNDKYFEFYSHLVEHPKESLLVASAKRYWGYWNLLVKAGII